MPTIKRARLALILSLIPFCGVYRTQALGAEAPVLQTAVPAAAGFSASRLERLHALIRQYVASRQFPGVVTLLAHDGKVIDYRAYGVKDLADGHPMTRNAIFRIFSMTKPVTAVAMMILYEQGKWLPADPISRFIPQFAHLKVFAGFDPNGRTILEDPAHPPTMGELMTQTAGFASGGRGDDPVDAMYRQDHVLQSRDLSQMISRLARIPLLYQPGTRWVYGVSANIEGYLVEKLSGEPLPVFMKKHIFEPLGMKDTDFYVPSASRNRLTTLYRGDAAGSLRVVAAAPGMDVAPSLADNYSEEPTMPAGAGGLVSTAVDYFRFAQMLANGGTLDGVRILSPSSVRLMTVNHVPRDLLQSRRFSIGEQHLRPGFGYGYDVAVAFDAPEAGLSDGNGTFLWDGAGGTWFWVDPANEVVFIGMDQRMLGSGPNLEYESHALVYQALVKAKKKGL